MVRSIIRYLAHSPTDAHPEGHALKDHLENVSQLSAQFCEEFGATQDGYICGLYHDIGKYSDAFQRRLEGSKEQVDHSTAGALLLFEKRNVPASMCIAGHHSGLADCGTRNDLSDTYMSRINRALKGELEDYSAWKKEFSEAPPVGGVNRPGLANYFYTKMLFSSLTDADWLDTEAYYNNHVVSVKNPDISILLENLKEFISPWWDAKSDINLRRCRILQSAIQHGDDAPGLFSMTVPTGGGKTVSSMAFALHHAVRYNKKRIIYVIPYCSILEQTQGVFESIFGKENIITHYAGAEYTHLEVEQSSPAFSAENWEAPIILTTAVQFFESLYSSKPGKNRKLHNIVDSILVFDEAQMLPIPFLKPCLAGICQLVDNYGCSAVLCTATQPALEPLISEFLPGHPTRELCPEPGKMYQDFRRVSYVDDGELSDGELVKQLQSRKQVLCVVNSRRQSQRLYHFMEAEEGTFHLSTMLIPRDRKRILKEVRQRLRNGETCRVISTSLIEAGVDVDFPEVFRALAGLDSIIQAGGRCNREGSRPSEQSIVHIFRTEAAAPKMLEQNISAASRILKRFEYIDAPEAVREYFQFLLYTLKSKAYLDEKDILTDAEKLRFRTVSDHFRLIDGVDFTVYIPIDEGLALVRQLEENGPSRCLLRQLNQYGVGVYRQLFEQLCYKGSVLKISDNAGILLDLELYSPATGLPFEVSEQNRAIFI